MIQPSLRDLCNPKLPVPTLKRWAIITCPSGTDFGASYIFILNVVVADLQYSLKIYPEILRTHFYLVHQLGPWACPPCGEGLERLPKVISGSWAAARMA